MWRLTQVKRVEAYGRNYTEENIIIEVVGQYGQFGGISYYLELSRKNSCQLYLIGKLRKIS